MDRNIPKKDKSKESSRILTDGLDKTNDGDSDMEESNNLTGNSEQTSDS